MDFCLIWFSVLDYFALQEKLIVFFQHSFNKNIGSFKSRPISQRKYVPEPHSIFGLFTLLIWAVFQGLKITKSQLPLNKY
jgi:hypothetical protein